MSATSETLDELHTRLSDAEQRIDKLEALLEKLSARLTTCEQRIKRAGLLTFEEEEEEEDAPSDA